jgi:AmpD protein
MGWLQYVPFDRKAWHAGDSVFEGREACNEFSIGIELEGTDDQPFTDFQYEHLVLLTRLLMAQYPAITTERIAGHSDIAPGRKTDPGPCFEWKRYRQGLENSSESQLS